MISSSSDDTKLEYPKRKYQKWIRSMRIGRWLNGYLEPILERARLHRIANGEQARAVNSRLSEKQVQEITNYLLQVADIEIRRNYFSSVPIDKTLSGLVVPLIIDIIERDPTVRTVLNIGAYYAFMDHVVAKRFPNIQFTAADLLPDMVNYNAEFSLPNLQFLSCYPLEKLESNELRADVTLFSATAAEIMNAELLSYFKLLANRTKYVVLSEPVYPLPNGQIIDPVTIGSRESVPAYAQPDHLPHPLGPVAYVHNYRQMLVENGFTVLHYLAYRPPMTNLGWILCIARANEKTSKSDYYRFD